MDKKLNYVLLIDDDKLTNFVNKITVEKAAITEHIEVAQSAADALGFLLDSGTHGKQGGTYAPAALIFLDIDMPGMNGWDFLEEYKNLNKEQKGDPVIVMLTASVIHDSELRAEAIAEISEYRNKPLTHEMIEELMQNTTVRL